MKNLQKQKFYRVKAKSLSEIINKSRNVSGTAETKIPQQINDFELYLIQEGVKQLLFAQGNKQITEIKGKDSVVYHQSIPREMIQFLLDYNMIEEFESTTEDYKTN